MPGRARCPKCSAQTRRRVRCSRPTCKTYPYCWQHMKKERGLRVKKSSIPEAGLGLYAAKDFAANEKIDTYTGTTLTKAQLDAKYGENLAPYAVQLNRDLFIDADTLQSNPVRYANDCRRENIRRRECPGNNAKFSYDSRNKIMNLKANQRIKNGQEIYVSYGEDYWRQPNQVVARKQRAPAGRGGGRGGGRKTSTKRRRRRQ